MKKLDIHESNSNFRTTSVITKQTEIAAEILANKSKEEMNSEELKNQGITFSEKSDYKSSQEFLNLALIKIKNESLALNEKNLIIAECYYGLANCEREFGNTKKAIELFLKAKEQAEIDTTEMENKVNIQYLIARNIGIAYLILEDYDKAVVHFHDAVNVAQKANQTGRIPAVKSYYGLSLVLAGAPEKGFQELTAARELYPKNSREDSMDWAAHRYHMGRAHEAVNNNVNALTEYAESRRLRIQLIDRSKIGSVYYHSRVGDSNAGLGGICFKLGCLKDAEKYLTEALENYTALNAYQKADAVRNLLSKISTPSTSYTQTSSNLFHTSPQSNDVSKNTYDNAANNTTGLRNRKKG